MPSHGLTIGPPCAGSAHCPLCAIFRAAARLDLVAPDSEMRSRTSGSHEQPTVMKALRSSQQLSSAVGMVSLKMLSAGQSMDSISAVCFCFFMGGGGGAAEGEGARRVFVSFRFGRGGGERRGGKAKGRERGRARDVFISVLNGGEKGRWGRGREGSRILSFDSGTVGRREGRKKTEEGKEKKEREREKKKWQQRKEKPTLSSRPQAQLTIVAS